MDMRDDVISVRSRRAILARLERNGSRADPTETRSRAGPPPYMLKDARRQFSERVRASSAQLVEIGALSEAPAVMREEMDRLNFSGPVVTGSDPAVQSMRTRWTGETPRLVHRGFGEDDRVALSHAFAGIAETGSLALVSGADNPVTLNYLPDLHIILLCATSLLVTLDDLWPRFREQFGEATWPRSIHLVTGPSRTADVEQTIQLGAHGPRKVLVILYQEADR